LKKIFVLFLLCLIPLLLNPAYADNSLQNTSLNGQSAVMTLDFEFGQDEVKVMRTKIITNPTLDSLTMTFYGDVIDLSDSRLKVYDNGKLFSVANVELGIIMYARYQEELDNYTINVYLATNDGLKKWVVTTAFKLPEDKVIETETKEEKSQYIPKLLMSSSHDFKTYWKDTFNIDVQTYDGRINPSATGFEGRIDGVDVKVLLSLDNIQVATLSGVTENGEWAGGHFFAENISTPGEYIVDVVVSYLGETVSKSSSMFIIGTTTSGDATNHAPISDAGVDQLLVVHLPTTVNLDGSVSSDPDGDPITFSWVQTIGPAVVLINANTATPNFDTVGVGESYTFQLTVSDNNKSVTDLVTVTTAP